MSRVSVSAPQYTEVVNSLEKHDLLPAIVFIGSRRGCDEAATSFRGHATADLPLEKRERIMAELEQIHPDDREFVLNHRFFNLLVRKGVAAHHAGHLPAWKHTVERLMSRGLLRAVFSTTTLAAGIDMPARSVVITASSLRDDEGHRDIKAFELAQMTGRAGRRGKDKVGFSIFIPGPFMDIGLIVDQLNKDPEPIESQFSPNYTMVLNLLQQHYPEDARELLERSFGHYQRLKKINKLRPRYERLQNELAEDREGRPCEDRAATWEQFHSIDHELQRARKSLKAVKKKVKHALAAEVETDAAEAIPALEEKIRRLQNAGKELPCLRCPQLDYCQNVLISQQEKRQAMAGLAEQLRQLEHGLWQRFEDCAQILQNFDYLTPDWKPTSDGIWAAKLRVENSLFISELVRAHYFATSDPRMLAALTGALAAGDREMNVDYQEGEEEIFVPFRRAVKIARKISQFQERAGVYFPIILDGDAARLLWLWAGNQIRWDELFEQVDAAEGDVVRLILRTSDLLSQLTGLQETHPLLAETARNAITLIRRAPIED